MSKSIVVIVVAVVALVVAGGAYYFIAQESAPISTTPAPAEVLTTPTPTTPRPDHGNFQKRFQPSIPPTK